MFKNGLALVLRSVLFEPNVDSMLYVSQGGTTLLIYASHNGLPISVSLESLFITGSSLLVVGSVRKVERSEKKGSESSSFLISSLCPLVY